MTERKTLLRGTACVSLLLQWGCFVYAPVPLRQVEPGKDVRVRFIAPRSVDVGDVTVREVVQVEGSLSRIVGDTAFVLVDWVETAVGARHHSLGDVVRVAEHDIVQVETEQVQTGKTVALIVGGGAAFVAAMIAIFSRDNKASISPGDGGNPPAPPALTKIRIRVPGG